MGSRFFAYFEAANGLPWVGFEYAHSFGLPTEVYAGKAEIERAIANSTTGGDVEINKRLARLWSNVLLEVHVQPYPTAMERNTLYTVGRYYGKYAKALGDREERLSDHVEYDEDDNAFWPEGWYESQVVGPEGEPFLMRLDDMPGVRVVSWCPITIDRRELHGAEVSDKFHHGVKVFKAGLKGKPYQEVCGIDLQPGMVIEDEWVVSEVIRTPKGCTILTLTKGTARNVIESGDFIIHHVTDWKSAERGLFDGGEVGA